MKQIDLARIKSNRFGYEKILEIAPELSYEALHQILEQLCNQQVITPVKKSGKTSFLPQVYREYRKVAEKIDYSDLIPEIRSLHPTLSIDRYLTNPKEFQNNRKYVLQLSQLLWQEDPCITEWMSVKEKSYVIWGDEKFMESKQGRGILAFHHLDKEALHYYYTPEPFFSRVFQSEGDVLILENKDPWYSIGRALKENGLGMLSGIPVRLLVYGEGNKITRDQEGLWAFLEEIGGSDSDQKIYYAGDIDRAGIGIFYDAVKQNPDLTIEPCIPLYNAMLQRGLEVHHQWEMSKDEREIGWNREFLKYFTRSQADLIEQILEENRRIPQEILNYQDYRNMCRG